MPKISPILFSIFFSALLIGCDANVDVERAPSDTNHREAKFAKDLSLIRDNLYQDKDGKLLFRVRDYTRSETEPPTMRYVEYFGVIDPVRDEGPPPLLKDRIDPNSWRRFHDTIYTDKNYVYCHHGLSGGGWLGPIEQFLPSTLRVIATHENGSWRLVSSEEAMKLTDAERAWHYTDGDNVIGYRCDDQGPLDSWMPGWSTY